MPQNATVELKVNDTNKLQNNKLKNHISNNEFKQVVRSNTTLMSKEVNNNKQIKPNSSENTKTEGESSDNLLSLTDQKKVTECQSNTMLQKIENGQKAKPILTGCFQMDYEKEIATFHNAHLNYTARKTFEEIRDYQKKNREAIEDFKKTCFPYLNNALDQKSENKKFKSELTDNTKQSLKEYSNRTNDNMNIKKNNNEQNIILLNKPTKENEYRPINNYFKSTVEIEKHGENTNYNILKRKRDIETDDYLKF